MAIRDRWRLIKHALFAPDLGVQSEVGRIASRYSEQISPPDRTWPAILKAYETSPECQRHIQAIVRACGSVPVLIARASGRDDRGTLRQLAELPPGNRWRHYRAAAKEGDLRPMVGHPLEQILSGKNVTGMLSGRGLRTLTMEHRLLCGETLYVLGRNGAGVVDHALPLVPTWVMDLPRPNRPTYMLTGPLAGAYVEPRDMFYWRRRRPADPYGRGLGEAQVVAGELQAVEAVVQMIHDTMARGGPGFIIEGPGAKNGEARFLARWRRASALVTGEPMLLDTPDTTPAPALHVHKLERELRNLQAKELWEALCKYIGQFWGVPPSVLGNYDRPGGIGGRSQVDLELYVFMLSVVLPLLEDWCAELQELADREYGGEVAVVPQPDLDEDHDRLLEGMKARPAAAKVDEWRRMMALEPLGGAAGNAHIVEAGLEVRTNLEPDVLEEPPEDIVDDTDEE